MTNILIKFTQHRLDHNHNILDILNLFNISGFLYIIIVVLRGIFQRDSYHIDINENEFSFFSIFRRSEVIFSLRASGLPSPVKLLEGHGKSRGIAAPGIRKDGGKRNWRRIYGGGNIYTWPRGFKDVRRCLPQGVDLPWRNPRSSQREGTIPLSHHDSTR